MLATYVVYADVLWLVNFVLDWVLLWAVARFGGVAARGWRLVAAAALGAVYGVGLVLPALAPLYIMPLPLLVPLIMLRVAFGAMPVRRMAWLLLCFYLLAVAMGGAALAVRYLLVGTVDGLGAGWLLPALLVAALAAVISVSYVRQALRQSGLQVLAQIELGGKRVEVRCFLDSGNSLREPLSGRPVMIVELAALLPLLPGDFYAELSRGLVRQAAGGDFRPYQLLLQMQGTALGRRLTLVPYAGVDGAGMLGLAVQPDGLRYLLGDGRHIYPREAPVLLPVAASLRGVAGCRALINPAAVFADACGSGNVCDNSNACGKSSGCDNAERRMVV